jgi:hypothetical protein
MRYPVFYHAQHDKHNVKMAFMPFFLFVLDSVSRILALPNPVRNDENSRFSVDIATKKTCG